MKTQDAPTVALKMAWPADQGMQHVARTLLGSVRGRSGWLGDHGQPIPLRCSLFHDIRFVARQSGTTRRRAPGAAVSLVLAAPTVRAQYDPSNPARPDGEGDTRPGCRGGVFWGRGVRAACRSAATALINAGLLPSAIGR